MDGWLMVLGDCKMWTGTEPEYLCTQLESNGEEEESRFEKLRDKGMRFFTLIGSAED